MLTALQCRAKAVEYRGFLDAPRSLAEASEFRNLEQAYTTLAENEEWLALNANKILTASDYDIVPTLKDEFGQACRPRQRRRAYSAVLGHLATLNGARRNKQLPTW